MKRQLIVDLLYLFAFLSLAFSIAWFFRDSQYRYLYTIVGLVYALVLSVSAYFVAKRHVWAWWLATIFIGVSILASIFDEVGWVDLIFITGASALFIILLIGKQTVTKV